jgi:tetratricopeptide (TPR) repeat protein
MRSLLLLILLIVQLHAFGQNERTYEVSFEERNNSISLVNKAFEKLNKGFVKESYPLIFKAIRSDSTSHRSYELLYRACMTDGNYSDSIVQKFYLAKQIFGLDDEICFYIAELYRMKNNFKNSISEYTKAIELSKSNEEKSPIKMQYYSGRALSYVKMNMINEAISDYTIYLKEKPDDAIILTNRGVCYQKKGKDQLAIADWKRSSELGNITAKTYLKRMSQK